MSTSALSASSIASDVPAVTSTRSGETGQPPLLYSAAMASRAGSNPDRRAVAVFAGAQRPLDGLDEMRRRLETEGRGVSDVEIVDPPSGRFNPLRFADDVPDRIRELADALRDRNGEICWRHSRRFYLEGDEARDETNSAHRVDQFASPTDLATSAAGSRAPVGLRGCIDRGAMRRDLGSRSGQP